MLSSLSRSAPRRREHPHARGHGRPDPPPRRAHQRPANRGDPQQARPAHRHRPAVHRPAREVPPPEARNSGRASRGPRQRPVHDRAGRARAPGQHTTIYRWLRAGLLPGEQTTPHSPWRIRLSDEIRRGSCPTFPTATWRWSRRPSGSGAPARPFCIRSPTRRACRRPGRPPTAKGLRIKASDTDTGLFDQ